MKLQPPKDSHNYEVLQPLLLSLMVVLGILVGLALSKENEKILSFRSMEKSELQRDNTEDIIRFIESKYVDDLDPSLLSENAIKGIIKSLDPHSIYIAPEQVEQLNRDISGTYIGLGIETIFIEDTLILTNVIPLSPADNAGLKVHDKILKVNGQQVAGTKMEYVDIRSKFEIKKGAELEIEILKFQKKKPVTIGLIIDKVSINVAEESYVIQDSIGYIKLDKFISGVYKNFVQALEKISEQKQFKHLIIDLRDNQGGFLKETVKITSQLFKEKDKLLVYTNGDNEGKLEYKSSGNSFFDIDKVVILINEGSASGSEIVAAAVQDWDRGILVGSKSFGKGLVQEQFDLNNGGALRLTVARYYGPSGRSIQKPYSLVYDKEDQNDSVKIYKSLKLKRDLAEKGGISPDYFVDQLVSYKNDRFEFLVANENILAYLLQMKMTDENISLINFDFDPFLEDYLSKSNKAFNDPQLSRAHKTNIVQRIKKKHFKQLFGRSKAGQMTYQEDPVIQKAIELIEAKNYFTDLK